MSPSSAHAGSPPPAAEPPLVPAHWRHLASSSPFSSQTSPTAPAANYRTYHDPRHPGVVWEWSTRGHRKGIPPKPQRLREQKSRDEEKYAGIADEPEKEWKIEERKAKSLWAFVRRTRWWGWDVHDISWWVAFLFTVGSVWWCIQGILVFCYSSNTSTAFTNTESAMSFLGGTTFLFGSYFGWVESFNPACSGSEDEDSNASDDGTLQAGSRSDVKEERTVDRGGEGGQQMSKRKNWSTMGWEANGEYQSLVEPDRARPNSTLGRRRRHFGSHLASRATSAAPPPDSPDSSASEATATLKASSSQTSSSERSPWRWYLFTPPPPSSPLFLGYLANSVQLFGAVAFEISVICGLPGVLPASGTQGGPAQQGVPEADWIGAYWAMQVIGSPCFIFAGFIFALETQKRWWKPKPLSVGWHVGFWNVVGGFGFWFCGIFGIWRQTDISNPEQYQYWGTAFSTFWGSWAFLLGSYVQLLEGLNKWS